VVTATWWAVSAADRTGPARLVRSAAAGACVALAYLARPEGLLLAAPLGVGLAVASFRRPPSPGSRMRDAGTVVVPVLAAFALPLVPAVAGYAGYLHAHTGSWQLTAKAQDVSIEAWAAVARDDREARDRILYAPAGDGWGFAPERSSLPSLARDDPAGYAGIVATNVASLGLNLGGWWLLPLPLWLVAAVGGWRRRRSWPVPVLAAVALAPVATALAFFVQPRYLVVTTAVATVLVGAALADVPVRLRRVAAVVTAAMLVAASAGAFVGPGGWWHPVDHTDQEAAGEWLAAHARPGDRVMTRSFVVAHFAERTVVAIPYDDLDGIVSFARHHGARCGWWWTGPAPPGCARRCCPCWRRTRCCRRACGWSTKRTRRAARPGCSASIRLRARSPRPRPAWASWVTAEETGVRPAGTGSRGASVTSTGRSRHG
jgi:hypothetical protein